jgi:hypothetical protein
MTYSNILGTPASTFPQRVNVIRTLYPEYQPPKDLPIILPAFFHPISPRKRRFDAPLGVIRNAVLRVRVAVLRHPCGRGWDIFQLKIRKVLQRDGRPLTGPATGH